MAESQNIEDNVKLDIKLRLTNEGLSNVITEEGQRPEVATFTRVRCINLRGNLMGGTVPTGMYQADMAIEAYSYYDDDTDGDDLNTLIKNIRDAFFWDDIVPDLNTISTYNTYYGMLEGDSLADVDDRYRVQSIQFSLILKPEKT